MSNIGPEVAITGVVEKHTADIVPCIGRCLDSLYAALIGCWAVTAGVGLVGSVRVD